MKSYIRITAALFSIVATITTPRAAQTNDDILGQWRITQVLDSSDITSLDDAEAAQIVGKVLTITPEKIALAGEVCKSPDFNRHYEDTVRYLREDAHAASGKLGLPVVVTVIDLSCTEALIKGHGKIVLLWQGIFFDAVRMQD